MGEVNKELRGLGWSNHAATADLSRAQPSGGQNELDHGHLAAAAQRGRVTAGATAAGMLLAGPSGRQAIGHLQPPSQGPHCSLGNHH